MNAPKVDVLAVMDALANYASTHGAPDRHAPMLRQARGAVAELIEASREFERCYVSCPRTTKPENKLATRKRMNAAIASIGGKVTENQLIRWPCVPPLKPSPRSPRRRGERWLTT